MSALRLLRGDRTAGASVERGALLVPRPPAGLLVALPPLCILREALATLLKAPLPAEPPASRPTRRWVPLAVSSILAAGVLVWITGLAPDSPASVHFSFAAFAAEGAEQAPLYASLGEEIAFGLQRATGVSVTRSDSRAVPAGWLVSG